MGKIKVRAKHVGESINYLQDMHWQSFTKFREMEGGAMGAGWRQIRVFPEGLMPIKEAMDKD
jgi:hypothetical protein